MFMQAIQEQNPDLIKTAITLHQKGIILPDTYVLDMDAIEQNASAILNEAKQQGVELFFMLKQIGRNPLIAKLLMEVGYSAAVVVDYREALVMMENNIPLGNVGHLVQVPKHLLKKIMKYGTKFITVYSLEKMQEINRIAHELGIKQKVMLRIVDRGDALYPGQYAGFELMELKSLLPQLKELNHVEVAAVTSFPCFLYNSEKDKLEETNNARTIIKAKEILINAGFPVTELNMPSTTSCYTLPFMKQIGGTQGEPGHALTGTTPMHAEKKMLEIPAYVYVSEVSHNFQKNAYVYGGGLYRRGHLKNVLLADSIRQWQSIIRPLPDENIDYYMEVDGEQPVGATAIMAFRTQIFVTRSEIAVVKGIQKGNLEVVGIYDSQGKYLRG